MKPKKLLALTFVPLFAACMGSAEPHELNPLHFSEALRSDPDAVLLDVRRPDEFAQSRIAGATLLNVLDTTGFCRGIDTLSRKPHYYLYCLKGLRSLRAARIMQERGFHVTSLDGGIDAWQQAGLSVDSAMLDK